jgi:diguanylate cyclase (GGDEF)-like protein/PAS domain S-box-containing protein
MLMADDRLSVDVPEVLCRLVRNEAGVITAVDDSMLEVLGWRPEQLIGSPSTGLVHPEDQANAIAAWFEMVSVPGSTRTWRGRYQSADGSWCWVESVNSNHLDDVDNPVILTVIRRITVVQTSVEEELRSRKQLLNRLADALPVGLFQVDRDRRLSFTNDRLHEILGVPQAADVAAQFAVIVKDDRPLLDSALAAALADVPVNDLELRFGVCVPHPDFAATRVCQISLRPLTDGSGNVTGAIGCLTDVTDSVELRRELQIRAAVDGLTGCLNRTATFELLDLALRQPTTAAHGLAVIFIDLDRFKAVNDRLGHAVGDQALMVAAEKIREAVRLGDSVGRVGGDEFLVICPDMPSVEAAVPVAQRISDSLRTSLIFADGELQTSASLGVAWTNATSMSPDALIARADTAMYQSKLDRAGSVVVATDGPA